MTTIDIISGFLGAGKTTLIKKLIKESFSGEKVVLIENEFGEIGIDGGFMKDAGIQVTEMNSGCICCSLVGDFGTALVQVLDTYAPDRIIIEPSGVGKLSDVAAAVGRVAEQAPLQLGSAITVVNARKCKMYMKNFGEFFDNQVQHAGTIILSRTQNMNEDKLAQCVALLREQNPKAVIITTDWDQLSGDQILSAMQLHSLKEELLAQAKAEAEAHHHHHHHHDDEDHECCHHHHHDDEDHECCHHHHHDEEHECCHHHHDDEDHECCHHHHDDEEHECCHHHHDEDEHKHHHHHHDEDEHEHHHHHHDEDEHEHHHHHHDEDEHEHHHHHHHEYDEHGVCACGHHHHGHDADEIFTSWGLETTKRFTPAEITTALEALDGGDYGDVLRAKGIVANVDGSWIHFDYTPDEIDVRSGPADVTGRLCVIGAQLQEDLLPGLFRL